MPLPKALASFNRVVTNRVARPVAARAPGFALVRHRGRRSGVEYTTPVNAFHRGDRWVIALTYGPDTDWVRNVVAAGGCTLTHRGRHLTATDPVRLATDEGREAMPAPVRLILRLIGVTEFLSLRTG